MPEEPKDLILLVWVHGFKGNEVTFESFPDRLSHLLRQTHVSLRVESRVFPAYETRGELHAATLAFVDWLTGLVVELENDHGSGGGAGKAKIVLLGHSMGGLLLADAALDIARNTRDGDPMWPHVVSILAFDTPYLGLHPHTFKHGLSTAASYYEQAKSVASAVGLLSPMALGLGFGKFGSSSSSSTSASTTPSGRTSPSTKGKEKAVYTSDTDTTSAHSQKKSWWSAIPPPSNRTMYGLGAVALGAAAAGTAYYRREDLANGWKFGYEHMTFVRNLWDEAALRGRLDGIAELGDHHRVLFRNFYTHLPAKPPSYLISRTFCILPPMSHPLYPVFVAASNTVAADEVSAHMGMFNPKTNDGFYDLGLEVIKVLGARIEEEGVGRVAREEGIDGWREEKGEDGKVIWVDE
ncbi:hypothetical protein BCR39DRAFT_523294 [Naematelia encephala]|uniref:DUF676 domain-containing protein n=1 Tax=Naematelia encephala TaxID=71784 RepID=A0A1Y2BEX2_9TREE|nr:hypothetical protein BCR39DRAFT_523294 [Naematelia encephala]